MGETERLVALQAHQTLPLLDVLPMVGFRHAQPDVAPPELLLAAHQARSAAVELPWAVAQPGLERPALRQVLESRALSQARLSLVSLLWEPRELREQQV
jgi:hypothetical protein